MLKFFFTILIWLAPLAVFSQKVIVQVVKSSNVARSEWQIIDENYVTLFSANSFITDDSVQFYLEANKRYIMKISVSEIYIHSANLYSLLINSQPVLLVKSDLDPGDHFFPFFTGIRQQGVKIVGGTDASIVDFPWQVFFIAGNYTCGGTIISGDWVITAAHCVEDDSGNPIPVPAMEIIAGANDPYSGLDGTIYQVKQVIEHQKYNRVTHNYDVALLRLSATINYPNATPIRLVSKIDSSSGATDPGVMSWVTGYGIIHVNPPAYPTILQKVQLPIVSNSQASTVWQNIPPTDMMAGYLEGNKDACSGDSGGPLVVPVDNEYKLAGLVSWGSVNCNTYGAYSRMSVFQSWVESITGIEIAYVPPVPSGDSIICTGITTSIYNVDTIAGATAYQWQLLPSSAGTISGTSVTGSVTWRQGFTGAVQIRLRVTKNGIVSYWSVLPVHVADYNNLTGKLDDTTICAGNKISLYVTTKGYNLNYAWYVNGDLLKSGPSPQVTFSNPVSSNSGVYKCDITGSCGNSVSTNINLTVLPVTKILSLTHDSIIIFGRNITLSVNSEGHNLTYQWRKDRSDITHATSPDYLLSNVNDRTTGLYQVDIKGTCGEVLSSAVYIFTGDLYQKNFPEVSVWPTLAGSELNVALSSEELYDVKLFSSAGKLIKEVPDCQYKTVINIGDFPRGLYILTIQTSNFHKSVKIIKY